MNLNVDKDGHLADYSEWTEQVAAQLAQTLDIELTSSHYQVLYAIRQFYQDYQHVPTTRALIKFLKRELDPSIDNQYLMQLFNTGLVARHVAQLAGLPKPANCL